MSSWLPERAGSEEQAMADTMSTIHPPQTLGTVGSLMADKRPSTGMPAGPDHGFVISVKYLGQQAYQVPSKASLDSVTARR